MKCEICNRYKILKKDFQGENDAHLVLRIFYPKMITCESCNDIIYKEEKTDPFNEKICDWE